MMHLTEPLTTENLFFQESKHNFRKEDSCLIRISPRSRPKKPAVRLKTNCELLRGA
jgi:hypothetical protein